MAGRSGSSGGARPLDGGQVGSRRHESAGLVIADRYRLEREIGTGGMATVWEATHLKLQRSVAIKLIDIAGPQSERLTERFLREARVAAAIRHRNVVDIIDFGTSESGRPFMAMELLVGRPLSEVLEQGDAISVGEVVRIMARVLSGLGAVHDAGIVHRDLKPENVFLVKDADGVYPKLLDFGVSRADPRTDLESVMPTVENAIVGTPQYMSPEQARVLKNLDHRSDLWSAGVILFELLSGRVPFTADAVGDIIIMIATEDPPDLAALRPDLAGPLTDVVMKALRRDPEARFKNAREMRAELMHAVAKTAATLEAGRSTAGDSDMPPAGATELRIALTEAYEPGDSALLDFTEYLEEITDEVPPRSSLPDIPPPPVRASRDPFARSAEPAPRPSRLPWIITAAAVALLVAGGIGVTLYVQAANLEAADRANADQPEADPPVEPVEPPDEAVVPTQPEEPATVAVTLEGLPDDATVSVDGAPAEGAELSVARGEAHTVVVTTEDGRRWEGSAAGDADATLTVELPAPTRRRRRGRGAARRGGEPGGESATGGQTGMIRDPGF